MSDIAIQVEGLGKKYTIGAAQERQDTLREALMGFARRGMRRQRGPDQEIWALRDVSFEVKRGEAIGVIGRNGAGKSTLLKILSRITEPSVGRAVLHGRVGSLLEVGTGFHPELSGRENIFLSGAILGMKRAEITRQFDEIIAFAEIEQFLDTPVKRYSSGMYVRLAFAVAAHLEPEILLVDEVLAVGDAQFQKKCLGKMGDVAHEGRTVLFVSHNMAAIQSLCDRAVLIHSGTIEYDGSASTAVRRYYGQSREFLGSSVHLASLVGGEHRQEAILDRLELRASDGTAATSFAIGEEITFELGLRLGEGRFIPDVGIAINDSLGRRVTTLLTRCQAPDMGPLSGKIVLACSLRNLKLVPDCYGLKLAVSYGSEPEEAIELSSVFEITPGDVWGTGKIPSVNQGPVLADVHWEVRSP